MLPADERTFTGSGELQQGDWEDPPCWPISFSYCDSDPEWLALLLTRAALCLHVLKVIELDKHNEKALYRRGEARLLQNELSLALTDFQQVLQINVSNRAARAQIAICQNKIKEHHEQDKRIYANMFQKFAEQDAKVRQLFLG